jgi:hypothetical protein
MKTILLTWLFALGAYLVAAPLPVSPECVVIVYNSSLPESAELAKVYQNARGIPASNLSGVSPRMVTFCRDLRIALCWFHGRCSFY